MHELDAQKLLKCISTLHRKTQIFLSEKLKDWEITGSQAPFLIITCENGPTPQNRYCELLDMSRGTVAKMLARLEEDGYVERRENPDDARVVDVFPTEKARAVYARLCENGRRCIERVTAGMSEIERMAVEKLLQQACTNICGE